MCNTKYDIAIVGGGIIGMSLALSLKLNKFNIKLIDSKFNHYNNQCNLDTKIIAINYSSVLFLKKINVWSNINTNIIKSYKKLEVWENNNLKLSFNSNILKLKELGYIIENNLLKKILFNIILRYRKKILINYKLININFNYKFNKWKILLNNNDIIYSDIVIGADGSSSLINKILNNSVNIWYYKQSCLLIRIITDNVGDTVWQEFYYSGPKAFLPLYNNQALLIWYDYPSFISYLSNLPVNELSNEIRKYFPKRLGNFKVLNKSSLPIKRVITKKFIESNFLLIGDAYCTIHPLAGQGVNIGFYNINILSSLLNNYSSTHCSLSSLVNYYKVLCMYKNLPMEVGIDLIYNIFNNNSYILKKLRNLGLNIINNSSLKKIIMKYALGLY
ncbi:MAG: FAD-dependent monooxygenase [Candidatus Lightella neohaematopini]|nr:FAD-dependent monooxygenase [Candidatus Lightella neohaematopini]